MLRLTGMIVSRYFQRGSDPLPLHTHNDIRTVRVVTLRGAQTLLVRMRETVRVCGKELSGRDVGALSQVQQVVKGLVVNVVSGSDRLGVNGSKRRKHKQADGAQCGGGSGSVASSSASAGAAGDGKEGGRETAAQTVERVEVFVRWLCEVSCVT